MKQLKVKNARIQRWLDYWTGWREVALVIGVAVLAAIALVVATKVSAL